jgi:glyoxylase-like metal-dependent hydrolase (beta-lactamase superfamily II)
MKIILLLLVSISIQAEIKTIKIAKNTYALVGETTQRSTSNFGNNSTHGVIVADNSVILIDSGGSFLGGQEIHNAIKKITNKPIKFVINTGGQDHRWFGNEYFQKLGATIISSVAAKKDHEARLDSQIFRMSNFIKDSFNKTTPKTANITFKNKAILNLDGIDLELYHAGSAHTLGDIFIYMPSEKIMFSGDIVFNDRMLGIGPARDFQSWINTFEKMTKFDIKIIIPGHGKPSSVAIAKKNTYDYLVFLKQEIAKVLKNDGDMLDAQKINQSKFHFLNNHKSIAGKNAGWVYEIMEFAD